MRTGKIGSDDFLRRADASVRDVRSRLKWRESYMRFEVRLMEKYAKGKAEGRAEGLAEGRGEERGRARRLAAALREAGRADEFHDAAEDDALYERLLNEFGIGSADEAVQEG